MAKIKGLPDTQNVPDFEAFKRFVTIFLKDVSDVVNGFIEFGSNIPSKVVEVSFPTANVEVAVSHGLGKVPTGYILIKSNVAADVYDGSSVNTSSTIYLKSNQVANTKIVILG